MSTALGFPSRQTRNSRFGTTPLNPQRQAAICFALRKTGAMIVSKRMKPPLVGWSEPSQTTRLSRPAHVCFERAARGYAIGIASALQLIAQARRFGHSKTGVQSSRSAARCAENEDRPFLLSVQVIAAPPDCRRSPPAGRSQLETGKEPPRSQRRRSRPGPCPAARADRAPARLPLLPQPSCC